MPEPARKRWIGAQELYEDSLALALRVLQDGYRPTLLAGLWRGGAPIAIAVHEALAWCGLEVDHLPLRTALYAGVDQRHAELRIEGMDALLARLEEGTRLLIVDDVFDTGLTMNGLTAALAGQPGEWRIATVWWKPARNRSSLAPDYFLHRSDDWLVFPHELLGHGDEEIAAHLAPSCTATLRAMRALLAD